MRFILMIGTLLFSLLCSASSGFLPLGDDGTLQKVQDVAEVGVFQILLLNGFYEGNTNEIKESQLNQFSGGNSTHRDALVIQLEICKKTGTDICRLWKPYNGLTGFVMGKPNMLVTAMHGFRLSIDSQARRSGYNGECPEEHEGTSEDFPLCHSIASEKARGLFFKELRDVGLKRQILILNAKREIVFQPKTKMDRISVALLPNPKDAPYDIRTNLPYGYETPEKLGPTYDPGRDWIVFQLPMNLGIPIKVSRDLNVGDPLTLAGFPMATMRGDLANSDGVSLRFSKGRALGMEEALELDGALATFGFRAAQNLSHFILTNIDAVHRNSGGPYLNDQGKVIGVIKSLLGNEFDNVAHDATYVRLNPSSGSLGMGLGRLTELEDKIRKL